LVGEGADQRQIGLCRKLVGFLPIPYGLGLCLSQLGYGVRPAE